jgi:sugar (pentulose or hexulose) kinase
MWMRVLVLLSKTLEHGLKQDATDASANVRSIALAGQMHSLVALGADDQPLRPAMLWNDPRGAIRMGLQRGHRLRDGQAVRREMILTR